MMRTIGLYNRITSSTIFQKSSVAFPSLSRSFTSSPSPSLSASASVPGDTEGNHYDVIICGGGLMGSSTADYIAQNYPGKKTLLIEQFSPVHTQGSSHGDGRIIRVAYADDTYNDIVVRAYTLWHDLEKRSGTKLLTTTGGLDFGPREHEHLDALCNSYTRRGQPFERLSSEDLRQRFPQFEIGDDCEAVYQQDAGVLDADECLTQLWDQIAQSEGVDAVTNSKVQKIIPNYKSKNVDTNQNNDASDSDKHSKPGTGAARGACASSKKKTAAVVLSDGCTYTADSVVLTPGAWINDLMTKIDYDSNNHTHTQTHNADAASEAERDRVIDNASPLQFPLYISDESVSYHLPLNHAQSSASSSNSNDNNNDIDGSTSGGGDASNQGYVGHTANDMPIWIGHFDFGIIPGFATGIYGLPQMKIPGMKIGAHYAGRTIASADTRNDIPATDNVALNTAKTFIDRTFPHLEMEPHCVVQCLYTITADHDFILDRVPGHDNIIVGAGFSGHGFKFGPAVGEILARLALHDSDDIQSQPPYLLGEGIGKKMVQIKSGGESSDSGSSERNALRSAQEKMSIFSIRRFFSEKYAGFAGHDFKIDLSAR